MDNGVDDWRPCIKCSAVDFLDLLHFPRFEKKGYETRLHLVKVISDVEFHFTMDPEKVGDHLSYGSSRPKYLSFDNQTLFHMLTYTICPLARTNESGSMVLWKILSMRHLVDMFSTLKTYSSAYCLTALKLLIVWKFSHLGSRLITAWRKCIWPRKFTTTSFPMFETLY